MADDFMGSGFDPQAPDMDSLATAAAIRTAWNNNAAPSPQAGFGQDIPSIIRDRANAYGLDPNMFLQIGRAESSLDPNNRARTSSATGLFQILTKGPTSEWATYGHGDPTDPYANADAAARMLRDKQAALTGAGFSPTPTNTYLAHFAGTGGAMSVLRADPSAPVSSILSQAAVNANPFLRGMTAGDLVAWAGRKMQANAATGNSGATPVPATGVGGVPAASGAPSTSALPASLMAMAPSGTGSLPPTGGDHQPGTAFDPQEATAALMLQQRAGQQQGSAGPDAAEATQPIQPQMNMQRLRNVLAARSGQGMQLPPSVAQRLAELMGRS